MQILEEGLWILLGFAGMPAALIGESKGERKPLIVVDVVLL